MITCGFVNTYIVIRCRLILAEYVPALEYTQYKKTIVADSPSQFPNTGNKNTTQDSNYITKIMSEINDIKELLEGVFPTSLK